MVHDTGEWAGPDNSAALNTFCPEEAIDEAIQRQPLPQRFARARRRQRTRDRAGGHRRGPEVRRQQTKEFLALNPNGKVPVLVDGDFIFWESRAINAYLAKMKPESGLYPGDARKPAIIDQASYWQAVHFRPAIQRIVFERLLKSRFGRGEADAKVIESSLNEVAQLLPVLDAHLAGQDWIAGALSVADFAVGSTLVYASPADISLAGTQNVSGWIEAARSAAVLAGRHCAGVGFPFQLSLLPFFERPPPLSTCPSIPTRSGSCNRVCPAPHPISRTTSPGLGPRASMARGPNGES